MTTPWSGISLTAVADKTAALTQIYPASCTAGSGATSMGTLIRTPMEGVITNMSVESDGTNGGEIEIWDVNGDDIGADVNTSNVITQAQLTALLALGKARLIWSQKFLGSTAGRIPYAGTSNFVHGLAARYINAVVGVATGVCDLNLTVDGGFCKKHLA